MGIQNKLSEMKIILKIEGETIGDFKKLLEGKDIKSIQVLK